MVAVRSGRSRSARRVALWREVLRVDTIHRFVVVLEVRQEDAHREHVFESEVTARQHPLQICKHLPRLGFDALGVGRIVGDAGERKLSGDEDPAILLNGVAEGRDGLGGAGDHVEEWGTHRLRLAHRVCCHTPAGMHSSLLHAGFSRAFLRVVSYTLACSRCGSPVHPIQHNLLKLWGLKTPPIMTEQQYKDLAITVLARPPQGEGAAGHRFWLPLRPPGM